MCVFWPDKWAFVHLPNCIYSNTKLNWSQQLVFWWKNFIRGSTPVLCICSNTIQNLSHRMCVFWRKNFIRGSTPVSWAPPLLPCCTSSTASKHTSTKCPNILELNIGGNKKYYEQKCYNSHASGGQNVWYLRTMYISKLKPVDEIGILQCKWRFIWELASIPAISLSLHTVMWLSDKTKWMLLEYQHLKSLTMFKEDWFEGWAQYLHPDSTYSINIHTLMKYLEKLESFFLLDREIGKW